MHVDVKIKKLNPDAVIPKKANHSDAGFDLVATSITEMENGVVAYGTGLAIEIPDGYVGYLFPRSSVFKHDLRMANSVGVIDSGYRGEIKGLFDLKAVGKLGHRKLYEVGDRVAQLIIMPIPDINLIESDELMDSQRGTGGFGSSGN